MNIIDISWPLSEATTSYKDKSPLIFNAVKNFDEHAVREAHITLNAHAGTHVDAPAHFIRDGMCIDQLNLSSVVGECSVIDLTHVSDLITGDDLDMHAYAIHENTIVLLKTTNSSLSATASFDHRFVALDVSGAEYLKKKGVKAVGIDYLGIERSPQGHPTHTLLMEAGIVIIEGLRLGHVMPGTYVLICLPLALVGIEAAPARAVLLCESA